MALVLAYLAAVFILPSIPVNTEFVEATDDAIEVYLLTNGVHTDLVLLMTNAEADWSTFVSAAHAVNASAEPQYAAFGWGDKGFYLNTPEWSDLTFGTAFRAMFFLSTTAMHVSFYESMKESASCRKIRVSPAQYHRLVTYVHESFTVSESGIPVLIEDAHYGNNDAFYEAQGTYNLFFTCNSWANKALKTAGMKACLWEALDDGLFELYPQSE